MYPIIAILLLGAMPDAGPLTAAQPATDRGEVRTGPPLTQSFELVHSGKTGSLTITGIDATCGCLQPTASKTTLQPGERCTVAVVVNTLTQPPGPNTWRATVRYRLDSSPDHAPRELVLTVSAVLIREVSVSPPQLELSTTGTASQTITLTDLRSQPLTILSTRTTHTQLTAALQPAVTENGVRTQRVELTVGSAFPPGRFDETLVLTTTDPECRELRVPVRVTKRSTTDVAAYPEAVEVRFARGQTGASGLFQVRRPGGGSVRIEKVECRHPAITVRWSREVRVVATVRVIVERARLAGTDRAEVRVILAEPPGKEVLVPISWDLP